MAWTIVKGPVNARDEIPHGEGVGNFDGDVFYFRVRRGDEEETVYVRLRGSLLVEDRSGYPQFVRDAVDSDGEAEVRRRLNDDEMPRCVTFSSGSASAFDSDPANPLMEP